MERVCPSVTHFEASQVDDEALLLAVFLIRLACGIVVVKDGLGQHGSVVACMCDLHVETMRRTPV